VKTLLQIPDLIEAINPLAGSEISSDDIFQLIGSGDIKPLGFIQRIPVFELNQIANIAEAIKTRKAPNQ